MSDEKPAISSSFYRGLATVGAIIAGWLFIESRMKDTFLEVVKPIQIDVEQVKKDVKELQPKVDRNTYLVTNHEEALKEYLKMEAARK